LSMPKMSKFINYKPNPSAREPPEMHFKSARSQ
jgi:hypothetical protein